MPDEQTGISQPNREYEPAGVGAERLHAAITEILEAHPDGLTPAEIIDGLYRRHLVDDLERNGSFAGRVVSTIVRGGFRVRDGKYFPART